MKIKKNYIIYLLLLLAVIICIIYLTGSDLKKFPFEAGAWGTFADYIGIFITGVSLYFIYHTLLAQNKVLEQQEESIKEQLKEYKINRLNLVKDLNFNISVEVTPTDDGEYTQINFLNNGDVMYNVSAYPNDNLLIMDERTGKFVLSKEQFNDWQYSKMERNVFFKIILKEPIQSVEYFIIQFEDYYGFKRAQTISVDYKNRIFKFELKTLV